MATREIKTCDVCGKQDVAGRAELHVDGAVINVSVDLCAEDLRLAAARLGESAARTGQALDKKTRAVQQPAKDGE